MVDEERSRAIVDVARGGHLLDPATVHHGDPIGHGKRLLLVVGDQNGRDPILALQPFHLDLHVQAQILVERAEWLIKHEDFRIDRQAAGQRNPLLLPAGQLARQSVGIRPHVYEPKHLLDTRGNAIARPVMRFQSIGDVLPHGHVRKERIALKYDSDPAPVGRQVVDALAVKQHAALGLANEARNDSKQGGFAATRRPEQRDQLTGVDGELHIIDSDKVAEAMRDGIEMQIMPASRRAPGRLLLRRYPWRGPCHCAVTIAKR